MPNLARAPMAFAGRQGSARAPHAGSTPPRPAAERDWQATSCRAIRKRLAGDFGKIGFVAKERMFMSQAVEVLRVKSRIKALTEKTVANGCTEAEAMSAAEMVGRLLERYALSMDEIEVRQSRCVQMEVPIGGSRRRPIDGCVPAIARFCDCKVWVARGGEGADEGKPPRYVFFGFETDTALAIYLFGVIDRAITTELGLFRQVRPHLRAMKLRRASSSFQHGIAARVAARLATMHAEREASVGAQRATGTALILVKHRVVDDAFAETKVRLVATSAVGQRHLPGAFQEGWAAGERINLNRPVQGGQRGMLA
jgi:hypothetical protein